MLSLVPSLVLSALGVAGPPPIMAVANGFDANASAILNLTIGKPGSCSCQVPKDCDGHTLTGTATYRGDVGCDYYAVGGGISTILPTGELGTPCHTWRADYKSCDVYPGSTDQECGRIVSATCTFKPGATPTTTLHAVVDMTCDTYHYHDCKVGHSKCCGTFKCQPASSGSDEHMCCPADTGCIHEPSLWRSQPAV